jgi:hypothetical protein
MDDSTKTLIKIGGGIAALYLIYEWLQSSGLWAQWFGGGFTTPQALLTYCQQNPTGTATYAPAGGAPQTFTCAQWIAAQQAAGANPPPTTNLLTSALPPAGATPVTPPPTGNTPVQNSSGNDAQAVTVMIQQNGGADQATLDTWAYYWQNSPGFNGAPFGFGVSGSISPATMDAIVAAAGGNRTSKVSASQFVVWLNAQPQGMNGLMSIANLGSNNWQGESFPEPYAWSA